MLPSQIIQQLSELQAESSRGVSFLYEAEIKLAELEHKLDTTHQTAFIKAHGTVADREALASLESADIRLQRDLAKAELNRIKMKLKVIESNMMAAATQAKLIATETRI